jgi:hypothetical protein
MLRAAGSEVCTGRNCRLSEGADTNRSLSRRRLAEPLAVMIVTYAYEATNPYSAPPAGLRALKSAIELTRPVQILNNKHT